MTSVVVIGGGLAGLTTAYRLHQQGIDVHLYEAKGRVGGRILSAVINGKMAELGGQNIADGGAAMNLRALIQEFDLKLVEAKKKSDRYYFTEGKLISQTTLLQGKRPIEREELERVASRAKNMRDVLLAFYEESDPLYQLLRVELAAYEGGSLEELSPFYVETFYHMLQGRLSAAHSRKDQQIDLVAIAGGNSLLPEKMGKSLGKRIHLERPLAKVAKTLKGGYELTFQNGEKIEGDHLVLAIPCSIYGSISFEDGVIPKERLEAIQNVHYGKNAKLLVPFSHSPTQEPVLINERMVAFFTETTDIYTLYYTGEASRFSPSNFQELYLEDRSMLQASFQDFCPPFAFPVLARDLPFQSYEGPVGYSWTNDPFVQGSYSLIAAGQESLLTSTEVLAGEVVKTLFAPIDQKLYFAGEHTSTLLEVAGTMEAASESGEKIARMIASALRSPN